MRQFSEARQLRIFTSERDRYHGRPFYEAVVMKARKMGLNGATVLRGGLGYGHDSLIHTSKILDLSMDLPLVIEIVDCPGNIEAFLPVLDEMMETGIVTIEKVQVLHYVAAHPKVNPAVMNAAKHTPSIAEHIRHAFQAMVVQPLSSLL